MLLRATTCAGDAAKVSMSCCAWRPELRTKSMTTSNFCRGNQVDGPEESGGRQNLFRAFGARCSAMKDGHVCARLLELLAVNCPIKPLPPIRRIFMMRSSGAKAQKFYIL